MDLDGCPGRLSGRTFRLDCHRGDQLDELLSRRFADLGNPRCHVDHRGGVVLSSLGNLRDELRRLDEVVVGRTTDQSAQRPRDQIGTEAFDLHEASRWCQSP